MYIIPPNFHIIIVQHTFTDSFRVELIDSQISDNFNIFMISGFSKLLLLKSQWQQISSLFSTLVVQGEKFDYVFYSVIVFYSVKIVK
jgi:hypothetical protein